jgi:hypothetical protein
MTLVMVRSQYGGGAHSALDIKTVLPRILRGLFPAMAGVSGGVDVPYVFYLMTGPTHRAAAVKLLTEGNFTTHTSDPLVGLLLVIEHPQADRAVVEQIIAALDPKAIQLTSSAS